MGHQRAPENRSRCLPLARDGGRVVPAEPELIVVRRITLVLVFAALMASCSDSRPTVETPPGPPPGPKLVSGTAHLVVRGDLAADIALSFSASDSQYNLPPAGFALFFRDGAQHILSIGGSASPGARSTEAAHLVVTFAIQGVVVTSQHGECRVTITTAEAHGISGTFTCTNLDAGKKRLLDADGTFSARA